MSPNDEKTGEIVLYQPEGAVKLEVRVENETVWLNRQQMSLLFNRDIKTIGKHISNAQKEELKDFPTVANFATVETGRRGKPGVAGWRLSPAVGVRGSPKSKKNPAFFSQLS